MKATADHINQFFKKCKSGNSAGVFYSLPFQNQFEFLLEDLNSGMKDVYSPFVFFPFDNLASRSVYLNPTHKNEEAVEFLNQVEKEDDCWVDPTLLNVTSTTNEQYRENFKSYQASILAGECTKAILSTVVKNNIPDDLNVGEYILKLRKAYPQAFIYLFSSPHSGTWIGATPETLLKWENKIVSTMSLAGTKKTNDPDDQFGAKEKKEQQIVTEYIHSIFENRFSNVKLDHTSKLIYGDMEHLITKVEVSVDPLFSKTNFLSLAADLHPTPAVGGYPKQKAVDLIKKTETHPRLYYSGYLGPINENSAHLVVNLRCMNIGTNDVYIFAGGGITADSDVELEWEETRLKAQALLKFLA